MDHNVLAILFRVAKPYPPMIITAKTGPVKSGNTSELLMTEYDSIAAIAIDAD
ncbi:MAG: hypothetical protein WA364_25680 [Candidatus Nitrosopolaris sp.]